MTKDNIHMTDEQLDLLVNKIISKMTKSKSYGRLV